MKCSELKYGPQKNRSRHVSGLLRFEYSDTFLLNQLYKQTILLVNRNFFVSPARPQYSGNLRARPQHRPPAATNSLRSCRMDTRPYSAKTDCSPGCITYNKEMSNRDCFAWQEHGGMYGTAGMPEVHHIIPLSQGGTHRNDTQMSLCQSCHTKIHLEIGDR